MDVLATGDPRELALPDQPDVVDVRIEYDRPVLEDLIRVWVIVADDTPESQLIWPSSEPIEQKIRGFFQERGLEVFPLVKFRTKSEFEEQTGEEV